MKTLNRNWLFLILTVCVFLFSSMKCDVERYYYIENNSDDTIYVYSGGYYDKEVTFDYIFDKAYSRIERIAPGYRGSFYLGPMYDDFIQDHFTIIFVFKKETLEKYSKEEIIENNIYDAKYILKDSEIKAMNYVVPYPFEGADQ